MKLKRFMILFFSIVVFFFVSVYLVLQHPKFGSLPKGERLERIKKSPNFDGKNFKNRNITPQFTGEKGFWGLMLENFMTKNRRPVEPVPSVKTDLLNLSPNENVLVWFGHASYFMQIDGKRFLVDPVFCGHASPFSFSVKAFDGTNIYSTKDFPDIDFLVITHDHWDHLDYKTIKALKSKVKRVITSLGVGSHLEYWGFEPGKITELDWYENFKSEEVEFSSFPARHFSGRGLVHKKTLWSSFLLQTGSVKIFIGGDGGYDVHFKEIGEKYGKIDLAILENGQYNKSWKYIHMMPDQVLQAAKDLNATRLFPIHNSKFALANHAWDTPLKAITEFNKTENVSLVTPVIGEPVFLNDSTQTFKHWWESIK